MRNAGDRWLRSGFCAGLVFLCYSAGVYSAILQWQPQWLNESYDSVRVMGKRAGNWARSVRKYLAALQPGERGSEPFIENPGNIRGLTLLALRDRRDLQLVDARGRTVKSWTYPRNVQADCPYDARLDTDGNLIVMFPSNIGGAQGKQNVFKLDDVSRVLWRFSVNRPSRIGLDRKNNLYLIERYQNREVIEGIEGATYPLHDDMIEIFSPDGELRAGYSVMSVIGKTGFRYALDGVSRRSGELGVNSVDVLDSDMVPDFPLFKAGDLLFTMAHKNMVSVMRPSTGKVVWQGSGMWRQPVAAAFLPGGHLLVSGMASRRGAPLAFGAFEYDPVSKGAGWRYRSPDDGETNELVAEPFSDGGLWIHEKQANRSRLLDAKGETVWSYRLPLSFGEGSLCLAHHYSPGEE